MRYTFLISSLIAVFILTPLPGLYYGHPWNLAQPIFAFVLLPILDLILKSPTDPVHSHHHETPMLYAYLPYHAFLILAGVASTRSFDWRTADFWLNAFSVGIVTGAIGITFAHEWVHKLSARQRLYGEWLLVWVCYGHYATEHVYGHHRNVGTREDGATARKNEWLQTYIFRALYQVWKSAFRIKPTRTIIHGLASIIIAGGIGFFFGKMGLAFFLVQSAIAVLLLTSIDYVEHYGLERKKTADGRTESMKAWHSWDSESYLMGELLIHLQRHSDHHMRPTKPYTELVFVPEAGKLPTGYAGMVWIAWWPHLWFKIMNPKVDALMERKSA